jgi:ATP-binding cassette subfamily D (ALD) long-chain fatty acid import protein
MAAFSTLRSKTFNERFVQFSKVYSVHRPLVQRCLNTAFIFYVLGSTYRGLSARPASSLASKGKGKGKAKDDGKETEKPSRVAVSHPVRCRTAKMYTDATIHRSTRCSINVCQLFSEL